jgi:hypothetical protein
MTCAAAFREVGLKGPQNVPRLSGNELVAKRIEELQARNERKAEMAAMTRDELLGILTDIVHATRTRLSEARPGDGLKAAEMLAKMCGWNGPEQVNVQSVEVKVDAALIQQLRAGYAEMSARRMGEPKQLAASVAANSEANGGPLGGADTPRTSAVSSSQERGRLSSAA